MRQSEKPSHLAPRRKGTTSLGRTGGVVAEVRLDPVEHCSQTHVRGAFRWSEIQVQRDRVEAGEEPAGQVGYGELENGRPHELGETGHRAGIAWRRCRETEAGLRDRHLESLIAKATAEVMNLVDDEEIEAIPELVHV